MRRPPLTRRRAALWLTLSLALAGLGAAATTTGAAATGGAAPARQYVVTGPQTLTDRDAVAAAGAAINYIEHGRLYLSATADEVAAIRRLGYAATPDAPPAEQGVDAPLAGFPSNMKKYHTYDQMMDEIDKLVASRPEIAQKRSLGKSHEGRDIPLIKISDNVATDEAEPEYLIDAHHHAREHLTVEMALYALNMFIGEYGKDDRVSKVVDSREIWVIPNVNPDGGEYDIAGSSLRMWRKNRQPNGGSNPVGTDLNRNYGYRWGCCNGSSGSHGSDTYRGASAFSAPEAQRVRDFVKSRIIGGEQQLKVNLDFHSYGEQILWPYAYTHTVIQPGMSSDEAATFESIGKKMAATNRYRPMKASGLYITDGSLPDWMWGEQRIFSYTFEMFGGSGGFYPADTYIPAETARNREATLYLGEVADCPYKVIGKEAQYCKG